jgi:septal ring factor EnvC (AmiA/AmiB activator)
LGEFLNFRHTFSGRNLSRHNHKHGILSLVPTTALRFKVSGDPGDELLPVEDASTITAALRLAVSLCGILASLGTAQVQQPARQSGAQQNQQLTPQQRQKLAELKQELQQRQQKLAQVQQQLQQLKNMVAQHQQQSAQLQQRTQQLKVQHGDGQRRRICLRTSNSK